MQSNYNDELVSFKQGLVNYINSLSLDNEEQLLIQETFISALLRCPGYRMHDYLESMTAIIRRQAVINNYRRLMFQKEDAKPEDTLFLIYRPDADSGVTNIFNSIVEKINHLNPSLVRPFRLYIEGYSYNEIADAMKIKIDTVRKRVLMARSQLMLKQN